MNSVDCGIVNLSPYKYLGEHSVTPIFLGNVGFLKVLKFRGVVTRDELLKMIYSVEYGIMNLSPQKASENTSLWI